MCYAVYIGTDTPQPTSEWEKDNRNIYIKDLIERDFPVRTNFSKPFIYYVGSNLGCGCGFFPNGPLYPDDGEDMQRFEKAKRSLKALVAFIEENLATAETVEVFVTWEGRQSEPPTRRRTLSPNELCANPEPFGEEGQLMVNVPIEEQDFIVMKKTSG